MKAETFSKTPANYHWTALDTIAMPFIFLSRIRHCAGYGVQSPTDYAFVREVIYNHEAYSLYAELLASCPSAAWMERKIAKLLLRLSNHAQAESISVCGQLTPLMRKALHLGCRKSQLLPYSVSAAPSSLIVFTDIRRQGKKEWERLLQRPNIIAYDLHYLGFAFHKTGRFSEAHIVNFY